MRVAVSARTRDQVEETANEIEGLAIIGDVSDRKDVQRMVEETERELAPIDLLVANAGIAIWEENAWEVEPTEWWHVLEVNVLGVYLCCRSVIPGMLARFERRAREQSPRALDGGTACGAAGRIVIVASGAAYLPGSKNTAYSASKAAANRFGETLAAQLDGRIPVFPISPGLVRTEMTDDRFAENAPWTPPECAPRLVRALASGRFDRLSGRYLHAEHDPPDELEARVDAILSDDLNAIRLRR
jgi:3-oxoacyl-[acyl-carrier protein] reductase